MAYTSVVGMNCSLDFRRNYDAVQEATCLAYDAVLATVGGPRLNCTLEPLSGDPVYKQCQWLKDEGYVVPLWPDGRRRKSSPPPRQNGHSRVKSLRRGSIKRFAQDLRRGDTASNLPVTLEPSDEDGISAVV